MKDIWPFEEIIAEQSGDGLSGQTPLSILSWNAGLQRGNVTNSVVGSCHATLLQEAESHFHEIAATAVEQFHIYQGADQLIMFRQNMLEPGGVPTEGVIPGTTKHDSSGLKYLTVRSMFKNRGQAINVYVHTCLCSPAQHDREEARNYKKLPGQFGEIPELNDADIIGGDLNTSAFRESGQAKLSSIEEAWKETLLIPPPNPFPL